MRYIQNAISWFKALPLPYQIAGGAFVVVCFITLTHLGGTSAAPVTASSDAHVRIASVASLSDKSGPLPVIGKVTSISKADILAVSSGEIVSLSRKLGDRVAAGSVIASFDNSSQRAAVLQAQGAYEGAQAALAKASGSTAVNSGLTSAQAAQAAENAAVAARAALRTAYASLDDAVHTKADALFTNPRSATPDFGIAGVTIPDGQIIINIENERLSLDAVLESVRALGTGTDAAIDADMETAISKARIVESFLGDIVKALNQGLTSSSASATSLATYQSSISTARSQALSTISSLTTAKSAYDSALASASISQNSASNGTASDIAAAEANVKSALGALNAAQANLEKTVIRAPISGTIVSLSITRGGYVPAFSQVAQISNPGALEIETHVTSDDAKTLVVGGKAVIEEVTNGVIVSIAPALDPTTGKIQVKIGLPNGQGGLTDGDTVTVSLSRAITGASAGTKKGISIPIAAAKITPTGPVVFTVQDGVLVAHPVVFGAIVGGQVMITSGISLDMDIVTDARGLSDGQKAVIEQDE